MFKFLRHLFLTRKSTGRSGRLSTPLARPQLEALQDRILPSATHVLHTVVYQAAQVAPGATHAATQLVSPLTTQSSELSLNVQGTGGIQLNASYETKGSSVLEIGLEHAQANQTYTVSLDGGNTTLATLTTNSSGDARIVLSNPTQQIAAGTILTLLDSSSTTVLQGTFASGETETHGGGNTGNSGSELSLSTQGTGGVQLNASYETKGSSSVLEIELKNAQANQTYTVSLDGGATVLATLTTNAAGKARVVLSNPTQQIAAGTLLTLLDSSNNIVLQGAFAAGNTETNGKD